MTVDSEPQTFDYEIDAENRITFVSPAWVEFARANDAPGLIPDRVIGSSLFDFMTHETTRHIYSMLLDRARKELKPVTVHFRCDGPDVRRFMQLEILARADGSVRLAGRLLRSEPRDVVPLLDINCRRNADMLTICSWCKRARMKSRWVELERAVEELELFDTDGAMPRLTHGICADCEARAYREIGSAPL